MLGFSNYYIIKNDELKKVIIKKQSPFLIIFKPKCYFTLNAFS